MNYKWPKTLGALADKLYTLREERLAQQRAVAVLEDEEKALALHILDTFPKQELEGARGKVGKVNRQTKIVPKLSDPDKFYAHLKKTGEFDLLQRRLHEAAFVARWDAGKVIPGTEKFTVVSLSISKA